MGARLLIILYALGIVIIGAHPIQQEYGSVMAYIKKEYASFMQEHSVQKKSRARLNHPQKSFNWFGAFSAKEDHPPVEKHKDLDKLTSKDRNELNNLLDDLQ